MTQNRTFYASWEREARACMDYLHGDVADGEFEAASYYENARESVILRDAAAELDKLRRDRKKSPFRGSLVEEALHAVLQKHKCVDWFIQYPWAFIWECRSFPGKPWNQLTANERKDILRVFPSTDINPLRMESARMLDAIGIFDQLKELAAKDAAQLEQSLKDKKPAQRMTPVLHNTQWTYALFTLDFTETKQRMLRRFGAWLDLPANKQRLKKFERDPKGKTGVFKDRLKDLAFWRLIDQLGSVTKALAFVEKQRKLDQHGKGRPFHDARKGQTKSDGVNLAPVYRDEFSAVKAKTRAKHYLAEIIPWEKQDHEEAELPPWVKDLPL